MKIQSSSEKEESEEEKEEETKECEIIKLIKIVPSKSSSILAVEKINTSKFSGNALVPH